jgi:hypothetical protein
MTLSVEPTSLPPMNTAGTAGLRPSSLASALSISFPLGSSSSSTTIGFTPRSRNRRIIVWHMQQELLLKITTGRCDASFVTRSIDLTMKWKIMWRASSASFFFSSLRRSYACLPTAEGGVVYIGMEMCMGNKRILQRNETFG